MISYLFNSLFILIPFSELLDTIFPEQFKTIATNVSYNFIYFCSKIQIYFAGIQKKINKFIEANPTLSKIKMKVDLIMKPSEITMSEYIKNGERISYEDASNCDFVVFSWLGDDKCIYKKIVYDLNEPITKAECSDVKFILIELKFRDKPFKVDLKKHNYNFYLVGNNFSKQFFIYFLKEYIKIDEPINDNDNIKVKIIDQNVNSLEIDFTEKNEIIVLEKTGYKVITCNNILN
jgi:hypothetical protein